MIESGLNLIKHYESLHDGDLKKAGLQPKLCPTGYATAGWGRVVIHPVTKKQLKGAEGLKLATEIYPAATIEQAEQWLREDVSRFEAIVMAGLTVKLNEAQIAALTSFAFNVGQANFNSSTMLRLLNRMKNEAAMESLLSWNKGTVNGKKVTLRGLVNRRKSEVHLFNTGEFKPFK